MSWKPCWHIQGHDRLVFDQCGPSLNTSGTLYNSYPQFQLTLRLGHLAPPNFQQASHTVVSQHRIPAPSAIPSKPLLPANPSLRVRAIVCHRWNLWVAPIPRNKQLAFDTPRFYENHNLLFQRDTPKLQSAIHGILFTSCERLKDSSWTFPHSSVGRASDC